MDEPLCISAKKKTRKKKSPAEGKNPDLVGEKGQSSSY